MSETAEAPAVDGEAVEVHDEPHQRPVGQALERAPGHRGSTELIHAATPAERVAQATEMATELDKVIKAQGMRTKVGRAKVVRPDGREEWVDRYHVNVEGWQTLATFLGLAVVPVWTQRVIDPATGKPERVTYTLTRHHYTKGTKAADIKAGRAVVERTDTADVDGYSWEARVEVYKDGALIGAGEGMCARSEEAWRERDDYALRGMAQTRAQSRAIGAAARWIVTLAGYSATPAEEMPGTTSEEPPGESGAAELASPELVSAVHQIIAWFVGHDQDGAQVVSARLMDHFGGELPKAAGEAIAILGRAVKDHRDARVPA